MNITRLNSIKTKTVLVFLLSFFYYLVFCWLLYYSFHDVKLLLLGAFLGFACLVGQIYILRNVVNSLQQMITALNKCAAGDFSKCTVGNSKDEISKLKISYNQMVDSIVNTLEKLNNSNESTHQKLQEMQARLLYQEKLASLGRLTAGIAHEIKNPLNFINNFSILARNGTEDIEKIFIIYQTCFQEKDQATSSMLFSTLKDNLTNVVSQGKRADSIIQRMLDYTYTGESIATATDIHNLLEESINLSYHGMRAQDSSFNVTIEKKFKAPFTKLMVISSDLSRVFLNILNNSYYSINQKKKQLGGSYAPLVQIKTEITDNFYEIRFYDNGNGIPDNMKQRIFSPFFTTKPTGQGTGIGLSLCYEFITKENNGSLSFETKDGEFAEFIIKLPLSLVVKQNGDAATKL